MSSDHLFRIPPREGDCLLRLILLRHGRPTDEVRGRCHGILDVGLSETGRQQIQRRLEVLHSMAPDALYSSTSKRAMESAAEIQKQLGLQAKADASLCEINFGVFEGLSYEEIKGRYPEEFKEWMERPTEIKFPGGESFTEMRDRALGFLTQLLRLHHRQTILAVSHAGVNRALLAHAMGLSNVNLFRFDQAYAGISVIDYFAQSSLVRLING